VSALELIDWLSQALFVLLFFGLLAATVKHRSALLIEATLLFGGFAFVVVQSRIIDVTGIGVPPWWGGVIATLVMAMPYLMLRLAAEFTDVRPVVMRLTEAGLVGASVTVFVATQPYTNGIVVVLIGYFLLVSGYSAVLFVRQARRVHGVTRRRLEAIALGMAVFAASIGLLGAASQSAEAIATALGQLLLLVAAVCWLLGFIPPSPLRRLWQEPELRAFLGRAATLTRLPDIDVILTELTERTAAVTGDRAVIGLWLPEQRTLRFLDPVAGAAFVVPAGDDLASIAFREQRTQFVPDATAADPARAELYHARRVKTVLTAPITAGERQLGLLMVYGGRAPIFVEDDLHLVSLLAEQAAVVLESRALIDEAAGVRAHEVAARLKEDFLSAAAHDLKTPLTTLRGQSQLLLRQAERTPDAPADRAGLARVAAAGERLATLVEVLLDASRIENGQLVLHLETLDLAALAMELSRWDRPGRSAIGFDADGAVLEGRYDRARMTQLLENLIENAVKYSPQGGAVTVRTWQEGDVARISVADSGIGISDVDLPHVFERFRRGQNVDDRRFSGMGLGLYISAGIVAEHGGRIWVESEVGRGSTFHVALPIIVAVSP
jgi:signal transduction histidine kinase